MSRMRTIKTVLATFSVALGLGFLVQYDSGGAASGEAAPTTVPRAVTVVTSRQAQSVFGVAENTHTLADHLANVQAVVHVADNYTEEPAPELGTISATSVIDDRCKVTLSAAAVPAAMAGLSINAPCNKRTEFVISHDGLRFSGRTDRDGVASVSIPVLSQDGEISVLINNMEQARTSIAMRDALQYDRTILQWRGEENLQLHVLEGDASFGENGHIWSGSVHTPNLAILGQHGFVAHYGTRYAAIPYQAEVYTYPARSVRADMVVKMPVGVMVTDENCDRSFNVQVIQVVAGQVSTPTNVSIDTPSCDNAGQFIVLVDALAPYTALIR